MGNKIKKYLGYSGFIILLLFLSSCDKNKDFLTNPKHDIPSDSVVVPFAPIDSKIIFKIIEEINTSSREVFLQCYTEKFYSPAGSKIIASITQTADTFRVDFRELLISNLGAAIFSPATVRFELHALQIRPYYLEITINNKKIMAKINVTYNSFGITIQPNNIITIYKTIINRIPQTIIWGQAESIHQTPYKLFLDSLVVLGAQNHNLEAGDYNYFEVDSTGNFNTHSMLGMPYGEFFLYNYSGDTLATKNLVTRFAKRYLDSIYIQLYGGRGEIYYSTELKYEQ